MEKYETILNETILEGQNETEKTAYLSAIASLSTADKQATQEESEYITALCDAAGLTDNQKQAVLSAATETDGQELRRSLDTLRNSQLKYSLVTDLISFANADHNYDESEQQYVQKIAQYVGVDQHQFALLDQVAGNVSNTSQTQRSFAEPSFLSSGGLKEKLQNAGINTNTLFKGLLAVAGPIILSRILSGRRGNASSLPGNLGGMFGGSGGGLGSLIGMLNGGRGLGSIGGLLGRVLGGGY